MSLYVKICGISDVDSALAAADAGADAIGFVFAESPRQVTAPEANRIAAELPEHVERVAVFLRPSHADIDRVLEGFAADRIQADAASLAGYLGVPVMPVVREATSGFTGKRVLFEGKRSGVGETANWSAAAEMASDSDLVLAGGLGVSNVSDALVQVKPFGVDVSSGVETQQGVKDRGLIAEFIGAVRETEASEVSR